MKGLVLALAVGVAACTPAYVQRGYPDTGTYAARATPYDVQPPEEPSLFRSDTEVLPDSAIRRILAFRFVLPDSSRVAVLHLSERSVVSYGWSTPAQVSDTLLAGFLATMRASGRVRVVSLLPTLLVPARRTVGYLREAAARYQADLLFVFRSDCQNFTRVRIFAADEVKATCIVESVLIDTRTGIIPFTANAARSFETRKSRGDTNWDETVRRAEERAIADALTELGGHTVAYLDAAH